MFIFCRKILINKPAILKEKGPSLLACNHPNSFLDAVILNALFDKPIYSLARGDVFKNAFYIKLLGTLKILPVYRVSEGVENLSSNYQTFEACKKIFSNNGVVLMFSEGKCVNEWHLRPLKKGTARLTLASWNENIPLKVLPVGINYSSFRKFGKNIFINFGEIIERKDIIDINNPDGVRHQAFNNLLEDQLKQLVFEIKNDDIKTKQQRLKRKPAAVERILLMIPAIGGYILHAPLYFPLKLFTWQRTKDSDHYDSIMTALLLFTYPLYLLLIVIITFLLVKNWLVLLLLLLIPFTAWSCVQLKPQLDNESVKKIKQQENRDYRLPINQ
jgi:1-acyl-sn-glycerol-3-phosphate acyltransferase